MVTGDLVVDDDWFDAEREGPGFDQEPRQFAPEEVRKVTGMAGVERRPVGGEGVCSSDLCAAAAERVLARLGWEPTSVELLILITQTPDYFLPQTSSVVHRRLGLG